MKLSTKRSTYARGGRIRPDSWMGNWSGAKGSRGTCEEAGPSRGCGGGIVLDDSNSAFIILATVSIAAEKAGGDSVQPIGIRVGTTMRGRSFTARGKGTANFNALLGVRCN